MLQYPATQNAVVTVTTTYYGADPDVIAGFITTPLENAIAQANGIDYMNSISQSGVSTITVNLRLNYDPDKALTEINTKISSVLNQLPPGSQQPILTVTDRPDDRCDVSGLQQRRAGRRTRSPTTWCASVQPKLQAVAGVQTAELLGAQEFRAAGLADPGQARRLRADRQRCQSAALDGQRLHFRPRQHQGSDGAGQPDRLDQPAHRSSSSAIWC